MILDVADLAVAFGRKRVLAGASFACRAGEAVALMGRNGAGKTTILRCILGLVHYRGRITVDGIDAWRQGPAARRRIGYVPQEPAFHDATAREVCQFVARLRGVPRTEVPTVLARVGLADDADRRVRVFSGGMRQRLSVAAALLGDPPVLLLDEPTANLDPAARADILGLLAEFRAAGKTLLLSSHRPREVRDLVDRVVALGDGRVVADGPPAKVLPPDLVILHVDAPAPDVRAHVAGLLGDAVTALPERNGHFGATLPSERIVPIVERLRAAGIAADAIRLRPLEDGGAA